MNFLILFLKNFSWSHGVYHLFLSPMNFRSSSWRVLLDHLEFIIGVFFNLSFIFFLYAEFFSTAISIKQIKYDKKSFTSLEFVNWDSYPSFHFLFFLLGFFLRRFWFYSSIFLNFLVISSIFTWEIANFVVYDDYH